MKHSILFLLLTSILLFFVACGNDGLPDYREEIVGEWRLKNAGELQRYLKGDRDYLLKNASITFKDDGTVDTQIMLSDNQKWFNQTGTWEMPKEGKLLTLKSDSGPFDDELKIDFTDERTFYLTSNGLAYQFIKL